MAEGKPLAIWTVSAHKPEAGLARDAPWPA